MRKIFIDVLTTGKRYILLSILQIFLFVIYYNIISPSNFDAFSTTLRNYLSALGTLLAVVVSFNILTIQNQLKNMPTSINKIDNQLDNLQSILEPVLIKRDEIIKGKAERKEDFLKDESGKKELDEMTFENAPLYFTDALKGIVIIVMNKAKYFLENNELIIEDELKNIYKNIYQECITKLELYNKTNSIYVLLKLSTTEYIQKLRFNNYTNTLKSKEFYETFQRLHLLKSFSFRIYIRNMLTDLSHEMLASAIPIITFIGFIASISSYKDYNLFLLRILFAISISIASIPFLLLLIRILPILYLIKDASTIPFTQKHN